MRAQVISDMSSTKRGFTILELLIVVAVIGILIGIVMGSAAGARRNARIQQANVEVRGLVVAIRAYKIEYGKWPVKEAGGIWDGDNADLVLALTAKGNDNKINFLEVRDPEKSLCDPFGTNVAYRIKIDAVKDIVSAWSLGPNKTSGGRDDIEFHESAY
jgi:type II secretion system protein G